MFPLGALRVMGLSERDRRLQSVGCEEGDADLWSGESRPLS